MIKSQYLNCAPFTDCISKISNPKTDHAKDINIAIPVYNLIEYSDSYLKLSGGLWPYYRDEPPLTSFDVADNFPGNSVSYKLKQKIASKTENNWYKKC